MNYIRDNVDTYSSMIKSEVGYASTNDYFSRKLRTDHQVIDQTYFSAMGKILMRKVLMIKVIQLENPKTTPYFRPNLTSPLYPEICFLCPTPAVRNTLCPIFNIKDFQDYSH